MHIGLHMPSMLCYKGHIWEFNVLEVENVLESKKI